MLRRSAAALLLGTIAASPAQAHHGWGDYDAAKTLTYESAVVESRYGNPHGEIVIDGDGKRWRVVLAPPSRMQSRGLQEKDIAVGSTVTVVGYPKRNGDAEIRAEKVIVQGRTIELR